MKRVQVQLTDEQVAQLRWHAEANHEPMSSIVRSALDDWMANQQREALIERALAGIGGFHSGLGDLAERHDFYLDEDDVR